MPDDLDRAVDAQIDAYRPATVPPFSAIEGRKRARDRRRMAVGAGALSVAALAGAGLLIPSLTGGGDRLTPGGPSEATAVTRFAVQYATSSPAEGRSDGADAALTRCLGLPGARGTAGAKLSDPIVWVVTVDGTPAQTTAVRDCLAALPDAKVQTVPSAETETVPTGPAGEAVAIDGTPYTVSDDGKAVTVAVPVGGGCETKGTATVTAEETNEAVILKAIVARPSPPSPPSLAPGSKLACPASLLIQQVTVALNEGLGGRRVIDGLTGDILQPSGPDTDEAFIERCVGGEKNVQQADAGYLGKSKTELDALAESTGTVIRVIGSEGRCLGRTRDYQPERVNVLLVGDRVIWAGRF